MLNQEQRAKWAFIRQADYTEQLKACRRCEGTPQLFVIDPVGLWLREALKRETFFAARCACGAIGPCRNTCETLYGKIDGQQAAVLAAEAWNAEQIYQR